MTPLPERARKALDNLSESQLWALLIEVNHRLMAAAVARETAEAADRK